ncbi:hypothetical protein SRHO_G00064990 [Serrasalmus rhombeus]
MAGATERILSLCSDVERPDLGLQGTKRGDPGASRAQPGGRGSRLSSVDIPTRPAAQTADAPTPAHHPALAEARSPDSVGGRGAGGHEALSPDLTPGNTEGSGQAGDQEPLHHDAAFRADRDGHRRTTAEVRPGPRIYPGDGGLRHTLPGGWPSPEATSKAIAQELFLLCSHVGIPKDTPFVSWLVAELCKLLCIKHLPTSVYHPETDGLVERFNQTLKRMLRKVVAQDGRDLDLLIPYILFAVREVPQASTGFSPFELLYSRRPRGLLDVVREAWEQQPSLYRSVTEYVREMQQRIDTVAPIVHEHMEEAQRAQQRAYNRPAQPREFQPGDHVLVLLPTTTCKFLATWQGPYTVREKVGPVNYRLDQSGRRKSQQVYHINLLKRWVELAPRLSGFSTSETLARAEIQWGEELIPAQQQELAELVEQFQDVFSTTTIWQRPYHVPEARHAAIEKEVERMLAAAASSLPLNNALEREVLAIKGGNVAGGHLTNPAPPSHASHRLISWLLKVACSLQHFVFNSRQPCGPGGGARNQPRLAMHNQHSCG